MQKTRKQKKKKKKTDIEPATEKNKKTSVCERDEKSEPGPKGRPAV